MNKIASSTFFTLCLLSAACGGSSSEAPPPSPGDATERALNGCTSYDDHSAEADPRTIAWSLSVTSDPAHCMRIKVGETVRWNGDLSIHPLGPKGGDAPNPISAVDASGRVSFSSPGTFGYTCTVHPSMIGAIRVVP
jgi:plastocyanin